MCHECLQLAIIRSGFYYDDLKIIISANFMLYYEDSVTVPLWRLEQGSWASMD